MKRLAKLVLVVPLALTMLLTLVALPFPRQAIGESTDQISHNSDLGQESSQLNAPVGAPQTLIDIANLLGSEKVQFGQYNYSNNAYIYRLAYYLNGAPASDHIDFSYYNLGPGSDHPDIIIDSSDITFSNHILDSYLANPIITGRKYNGEDFFSISIEDGIGVWENMSDLSRCLAVLKQILNEFLPGQCGDFYAEYVNALYAQTKGGIGTEFLMNPQMINNRFVIPLGSSILIEKSSENNNIGATVQVYLNGTQVSFPDQQPFVDPSLNRTFVPIRFIAENMGATVTWDADTQTATITKDGKTIKISIGSSNAVVDGSTVPIDAAARMVKGRTMVPLRFVSEALGAQVTWDGAIHISATGNINTSTPITGEEMDEVYQVLKTMGNAEYTGDLILWSETDNPGSSNDLHIVKSSDGEFSGAITTCDENTLMAFKKVLHVFYPTGYESVYSQVSLVIDSGGMVQGKYYDGRMFSASKSKYDGQVGFSIGKLGVKY